MQRYVYAVIAITAALGGCAQQEAKKAVGSVLSDPASAQYRNVQKKGEVLCGEVNAKNRMGGYVGFARFMVRDGAVAIDPATGGGIPVTAGAIADQFASMAFDTNWNTYCVIGTS